MAREVVTAALAEKVLSGYLTGADARELAVKFLRNNAIDLYRLKVPKARAPGETPGRVGQPRWGEPSSVSRLWMANRGIGSAGTPRPT
jgi:hypothetical protein